MSLYEREIEQTYDPFVIKKDKNGKDLKFGNYVKLRDYSKEIPFGHIFRFGWDELRGVVNNETKIIKLNTLKKDKDSNWIQLEYVPNKTKEK